MDYVSVKCEGVARSVLAAELYAFVIGLIMGLLSVQRYRRSLLDQYC